MRIRELLDEKGRDVFTIGVNDTLATVFTVLAENRVGALVVRDADNRVIGIISERDLVRAIAQDGERVLSWPVEVVMTKEVITANEDDTVDMIMEKMTTGRFRHVPVIVNGGLMGVISIGDVVKHRIQEVEREAADIRAYIHAI